MSVWHIVWAFILGMVFALFGVSLMPTSSDVEKICVPPSIVVPREAGAGDCIAMNLIDGKPTTGWYVLRERYDDGGWQADRYRTDGRYGGESSITYPEVYTRIACPVRE